MESRWVRGTSGWARHSVVIDVPIRASFIVVGAALENTGSLWIDEASLQIVPQATPLTQPPRPATGWGSLPAPSKFPTALQNGGFMNRRSAGHFAIRRFQDLSRPCSSRDGSVHCCWRRLPASPPRLKAGRVVQTRNSMPT
jgi:hypothetical protein